MMSWVRILLIATGAASVVHGLWLHPGLPEMVASHFGPSGRPDAWMSRDAFVWLYVMVVLSVVGLGFGTEWMIRRGPVELINFPHREYWFAAPRREATSRWVVPRVVGLLLSGAWLVMLSVQLAADANASRENIDMAWMLGAVSLYTLLTVVVVATSYRRFGAPSDREG